MYKSNTIESKEHSLKKTNVGKQEFDPQLFESKWQTAWEKNKLFSPDLQHAKNPYYNLMMFPYPSAEGLHVGNMYAFTGADVYARWKRMQGKDVFEPIGLDGFGIHSENYALKVGRHPIEQAKITEKNFYRQLRSIGNSFDWQNTLETYSPDYYKWTQWLFVTMFKNGLAYRDSALVNWCPKDLTVLSDEQVIDGCCERCGSKVEKKDLEQWFFRITKYAKRLLDNIEDLKWSERVKIAQKNWIGKSEGVEIEFVIANEVKQSSATLPTAPRNAIIKIFTTRPDTLFGVTFMVIAPEHELAQQIADSKWPEADKEGVSNYIESIKNKSEIERTRLTSFGQASIKNEKTGVITGLFAINPINSKKIPILVSDYVLSGYGTGAIMAVPAHDQRDYATAKKFGFEIIPVIQGKEESMENKILSEAFEGEGIIIGSEEWNGFQTPKDIGKVVTWLEKRGLGKKKENYHLRDWLISRQRYWGPPIPMIFCKTCKDAGRSWFTSEEAKEENESRIKYKHSFTSYKQSFTPYKHSFTPYKHSFTSYKQSFTPYQKARKNDLDSSFIIHDSSSMAGWYPVPEKLLPVLLPNVSDWKPMGTGKAPLANHPEFYNTKCPSCGEEAVRETDVSDTFLDSSWYYLRYIATDLDIVPFPSEKFINSKSEITNSNQAQNQNEQNLQQFNTSNLKSRDVAQRASYLPVDMYIGGAEHAVLHLLYSRFVTMTLYDLGFLSFEEPFLRFFAHGLIIKDGAKMSKSKGNIIVPDAYITKYGADTLRCYLMFLGPYSDGGDFRDSGIEGMHKFLRRVWKLIDNVLRMKYDASSIKGESKELDVLMNKTVKEVTEDIANFKYNTAIAKLMEYYNGLLDYYTRYKIPASPSGRLDTKYCKVLILLLAPFAPHMTEELYQRMRVVISNSKEEKFESIHTASWPQFDENKVKSTTIIVPIQINGKRRGEIEIKSEKAQFKDEVEKLALAVVAKQLDNKKVKKVIYVPGKIINFVV